MSDQPSEPNTAPVGPVRRRSGWRRTGLVTLVTVLVLVLTAGAAVGLLWWRGEASLDRISVEGLNGRGGDPAESGDVAEPDATSPSPDPEVGGAEDDSTESVPDLVRPFVVLVAGVDGDTSGLTDEQRRRVAIGGEREGQRPDTIILLRVDPGRDQVAMLSLPRDLLVRRCDGSLGKINGAYEVGIASDVGGPTCLVRTISRHTGIAIQHYAEVSFAGFLEVIDAIGGVRMHIPERLYDEDAKLDLEPGCQVLDGPDALAYARVRNFDSDFGRMARQQVLAEEVLDGVTSAGTLANPLRLYRLVEAAAGAVDVDDTLGLEQMRHIARSLRNLDSDRLATASVTGDIVTREDLGGASVVVEDRSVTEPLYRAFREGRLTEGLPSSEPPATTATEEPTATPTVPIVDAAQVPALRVLNAAGVAQLAARTGAVLEQRGFRVAELGDAPIGHSRSVVQHGPGLEAEAATVAQALGGIPTRQRIDLPGVDSGDSGGIVVVLGDDMDPEGTVDLRGAVSPSPSATDGPTPTASEVPLPQPSRDFKGIPSEDQAC